jgi:hypothetical protein
MLSQESDSWLVCAIDRGESKMSSTRKASYKKLHLEIEHPEFTLRLADSRIKRLSTQLRSLTKW